MKKQTAIDTIALLLVRYVHGMEEDELLEEYNRARVMTTTNCWWVSFGLRQIVLEVIDNEVRVRRHSEIMEAIAPSDTLTAEISRKSSKDE